MTGQALNQGPSEVPLRPVESAGSVRSAGARGFARGRSPALRACHPPARQARTEGVEVAYRHLLRVRVVGQLEVRHHTGNPSVPVDGFDEGTRRRRPCKAMAPQSSLWHRGQGREDLGNRSRARLRHWRRDSAAMRRNGVHGLGKDRHAATRWLTIVPVCISSWPSTVTMKSSYRSRPSLPGILTVMPASLSLTTRSNCSLSSMT